MTISPCVTFDLYPLSSPLINLLSIIHVFLFIVKCLTSVVSLVSIATLFRPVNFSNFIHHLTLLRLGNFEFVTLAVAELSVLARLWDM